MRGYKDFGNFTKNTFCENHVSIKNRHFYPYRPSMRICFFERTTLLIHVQILPKPRSSLSKLSSTNAIIKFVYFISLKENSYSTMTQKVIILHHILSNMVNVWVESIIEGFRQLGGTARFNTELYPWFEKNKASLIENKPSWKEIIRGRIYERSSDSSYYKHNQPDMFYSVKGKGKGVWGLRDSQDILTPDISKPDSPAIVQEEELKARYESLARKAKRLSTKELIERAHNSRPKPKVRNVVSKHYDRNQYMVELINLLANGHCMLCESKAPFNKSDGTPFLETHHITWLARNGDDTFDNIVALCPNCHRRMHSLNTNEDRNKLLLKNKNVISDIIKELLDVS